MFIDSKWVWLVGVVNMYIVISLRADYETYLHRIGRTGRFGRSGLAINFVDGRRSLEIVKKIEQHFGKNILKMEIDDPDSIEQAVSS